MAFTPSVPAARAAVAAFLDANLDVSATYARPRKLAEVTDLVYGLPARGYQVRPGEQWHIETYELAVGIEVFRPGDDVTGADERRWELIADCLTALRSFSVGGLQLDDELNVVDDAETAYDMGWVASSIILLPVLRRFKF